MGHGGQEGGLGVRFRLGPVLLHHYLIDPGDLDLDSNQVDGGKDKDDRQKTEYPHDKEGNPVYSSCCRSLFHVTGQDEIGLGDLGFIDKDFPEVLRPVIAAGRGRDLHGPKEVLKIACRLL